MVSSFGIIIWHNHLTLFGIINGARVVPVGDLQLKEQKFALLNWKFRKHKRTRSHTSAKHNYVQYFLHVTIYSNIIIRLCLGLNGFRRPQGNFTGMTYKTISFFTLDYFVVFCNESYVNQ